MTRNHAPALALALALASCAPRYAVTCGPDGRAVTAGHNVGRVEPLVELPRLCPEPKFRAARTGEAVTVGKDGRRATVTDPNWAGWLVATGAGIPGESGSGVYGADGALLAIAVETRQGMTYARIPRKIEP
jgi:hypothetical protein